MIARLVHRRSGLVILASVVVTAVMGNYALQIKVQSREKLYLPEGDLARQTDEVSEDFGDIEYVQIIVRSREADGTVLFDEPLAEMLELEREIVGAVEPVFMSTPQEPEQSVRSIADVIIEGIARSVFGLPPPTLEQKLENVTGENRTLIEVLNLLCRRADPGWEERGRLDEGLVAKVLDILLFHPPPDPEGSGVPAISETAKARLLSLLSTDFASDGRPQAAVVVVQLVKPAAEGGRLALLDRVYAIRDIIHRHNKEPGRVTDFMISSIELIHDESIQASTAEYARLIPLAFLIILAILVLTYRNAVDTFATITCIGMAMIWMTGTAALLRFTFTPLTLAAPIVIIGLGVDYGIHLIMRYREARGSGAHMRGALDATIGTIGSALLLTTATTVMGFLSNYTSPIGVVREMGVLCAVGILSAFILMSTYVLAVRASADRIAERWRRHRPPRQRAERAYLALLRAAAERARRGLGRAGGRAAARGWFAVLTVALLLGLGGGYLSLSLRTEFKYEDFLPPESEGRQSLDYLLGHFEITGETLNVVVSGDAADPATLWAVDAAVRNMAGNKRVVVLGGEPQVESILTVLARTAEPTDPSYSPVFASMFRGNLTVPDDPVPATHLREMYDWLYVNREFVRTLLRRAPDGRGGWRYTGLRLIVRVDTDGMTRIPELKSEMAADLEPLRVRGLGVSVTGSTYITWTVMEALRESQLNSLRTMLAVTVILLIGVYAWRERSAVLGLLTIFPVVLVILMVWGTMVLADIPLNMMTTMIASFAVGMGIDYSIHVSHRFAHELKLRCGKERKKTHGRHSAALTVLVALERAISTTGLALLGSGLTTIGGFLVLAHSYQPLTRQFGTITALSILYSILASLFFLPSLLYLWGLFRLTRARAAERGSRGATEK